MSRPHAHWHQAPTNRCPPGAWQTLTQTLPVLFCCRQGGAQAASQGAAAGGRGARGDRAAADRRRCAPDTAQQGRQQPQQHGCRGGHRRSQQLRRPQPWLLTQPSPAAAAAAAAAAVCLTGRRRGRGWRARLPRRPALCLRGTVGGAAAPAARRAAPRRRRPLPRLLPAVHAWRVGARRQAHGRGPGHGHPPRPL